MASSAEYQRQYRASNKNHINALAAAQRAKDRDKINARQREQRRKIKEARLAAAPRCGVCGKPLAAQNRYGYCYLHGRQARWQEFYSKNKADLLTKQKIRHKNRKLIDPAYRACVNARNRVRSTLLLKPKYSKHLGCSFLEFKTHIESQFQPGMAWENYGAWEIDHKYPLSKAYADGPEAFARACRFDNLQPLWKADNVRKGARINRR
jgi:hypothetical protein